MSPEGVSRPWARALQEEEGAGERRARTPPPPTHGPCIPGVLPTRMGSHPGPHVPTTVARGVTAEDVGEQGERPRGSHRSPSLGSTCHRAARAPSPRPRQPPASHDPSFRGAPENPPHHPVVSRDHQPSSIPGAFFFSSAGEATASLPAAARHPPAAGSVPGSSPAPPASGSRGGGWMRGEAGRPPLRAPPLRIPGDAPGRAGTGRAGSGRARRPHPAPSEPNRAPPPPPLPPQPGPHRPVAVPVSVSVLPARRRRRPPSAAAAAAESRCRGGGQRERMEGGEVGGGWGGERPLPAPGLPPPPPVRPARPCPVPGCASRGSPAPSAASPGPLALPDIHPRDPPPTGKAGGLGPGWGARPGVEGTKGEQPRMGVQAVMGGTAWDRGHSLGWRAQPGMGGTVQDGGQRGSTD